jgi:hypothetical protein
MIPHGISFEAIDWNSTSRSGGAFGRKGSVDIRERPLLKQVRLVENIRS